MTEPTSIQHRCAVIGHPALHSLSPALHTAAYEQLGLHGWQYEAIDVAPGHLDEFLAGLDGSWAGLSVTMPFKSGIIAHGEPEPLVTALNAANTIIFGEPNRCYNTDVPGMVDALAHRGLTSAGSAVLLGAGATARSALAALSRIGVEHVEVVARSAGRAHASLDEVASHYGIGLSLTDWEELAGLGADRADLLLSSVPVDFSGEEAERIVRAAPAVFDIVYLRYPSALSEAAVSSGRVSVDGVDLLVFQGIEQVRLMTGRTPSQEPLLAACAAEVARRARTGAGPGSGVVSAGPRDMRAPAL
ncbi:shikimate dehydrogenase [uncultured Propionibacterium sp.]|uniref:shikimate dehydrogenase family protein n=1 Tax=uncultured Propionibacterium sp. TaxID=218066 RepID=UPI00292EFEB9|nr:shikimate dehydrogenase [uncultured Propionibacterium sp.]